ncbi:hypothetical protein [Streptomyces virginiae]
MNRAQTYDCYFDTDRVPALLEQLERESDAEAWKEPGYRLVLEHDLVSPASFTALPRLVRLASGTADARRLAGEIVERAAGQHGCDELLEGCADAIVEFRGLLDKHLRSRPADHLIAFRALLAVQEEYHWAAAPGDFTDDFHGLGCPHRAVMVTIAIGNYGRYSASRNRDLGDVDRRDLRPASAERLSGVGRWTHEITARDEENVLADGILHLFGKAECPNRESVFSIAVEYAAANRPVLR